LLARVLLALLPVSSRAKVSLSVANAAAQEVAYETQTNTHTQRPTHTDLYTHT